MATLQEQDDKLIAEWTRIFRLSRKLRHNVQQSMKDATLFITEECIIVHPKMSKIKKIDQSDIHATVRAGQQEE